MVHAIKVSGFTTTKASLQSKQRDQKRSDGLAESVNRRGFTFRSPVEGQLLSEEKILGREGCSRLGQSDSEPEDIVDQA